jgi:LPXTG-site transpeptidase (sortase) family protein
MEEKISKTVKFSFGLILIGIMILSYNFILSKRSSLFNEMNLQILEVSDGDGDVIASYATNITIENNADETPVETTETVDYEYIGYIEIPKVNFKQGLVAMDSPYNYVNYNIQTIAGSSYPDVERGNYILAAHNGSSYIAFFKVLRYLDVGDEVNIYYKNKTYTYVIDNIYDVQKTGSVTIYRDKSKTTLTLITCRTENIKKEQTVYVAYIKE